MKPSPILARLFNKILVSFSRAPTRVELHLVKSKTMKDLNSRFRKQNKTTDVLSFSSRHVSLLGSVVIDVETALKQAKAFGHPLQQEIQDLFVHGVLHLLGMDHHTSPDAEKMARYEKYFESVVDQATRKKRA